MKFSKTKAIIIGVVTLLLGGGAIAGGIAIANHEKQNTNPFVYEYPTSSRVGQWAEYLGTTTRTKPEERNGGLARYPEYGVELKKTAEETEQEFIELRQNILKENRTLITTPQSDTLDNECTGYDEMDQYGYLYLNGQHVLDENGEPRKLYKHTAANGMYYGNVLDSEPAIIKRITYSPRSVTDTHLTGLYAPAGEVIKIEISQEDLNAVGGLNIFIGQTLANGQANNIWIKADDPLSRAFVRMPIIANRMPVKKTVCYVGSFLGGPIYVGRLNKKADFTLTISGAVRYNHFILGATSPQEFEENKKSSAPYFDLEVWDDAIRFSGTNIEAKKYSYDELYKSAILWDKISRVSNAVPNAGVSNVGITFVFEPFIAAGAAVAFVGRNTVNNPISWFSSMLDVEDFILNGAWGNIHEFNHHYQNFGLPYGGEVTNNAMNLVEYVLFTKISAKRTVEDAGLGNDWQRFTDPTRALKTTLNVPVKKEESYWLSEYANILHAFGAGAFIKVVNANVSINSNTVARQEDRWYLALCNTLHYDFDFYMHDLCGWDVSQQYLTQIDDLHYPTFVPVASSFQTGRSVMLNGQKTFCNTVQPFEIEQNTDFEFNLLNNLVVPSRFNAQILTVSNPEQGELKNLGDGNFCYNLKNAKTSGKIYATIKLTDSLNQIAAQQIDLVLQFNAKTTFAPTITRYAFNGVEQFETIEDALNNLSQATSVKTESYTTTHFVCERNELAQIEGKFRVKEAGSYRFAVGARYLAQAEISLDGVNYVTIANFKNVDISTYVAAVENGYFKDFNLQRKQWVYYKLTVLGKYGAKQAYVALGFALNSTNAADIVQVNLPLYSQNSVIELPQVDYFFNHEYFCDNLLQTKTSPTVVQTNFVAESEQYKIENLFDGTNSVMHSRNTFNAQNPFELTVDLGTLVTANKLTLVGRHDTAPRNHTPLDFKLFLGSDLNNLALVGNYEDCQMIDSDVSVDFNNTTFRFYKIVATRTSNNKYVCLRAIDFKLDFAGGQQFSPDNASVAYFGNWNLKFNCGNFGHVYSSKNATMEIEFFGKQIALLTKNFGQCEFEISLDNGKPQKVKLTGNDANFVYVCAQQTTGKHKVKIKTIKNFNFDSFIVR